MRLLEPLGRADQGMATGGSGRSRASGVLGVRALASTGVISGLDAKALRLARERAGLTQSDLARMIGVVGGERVSRWELGRSQPRPDLLKRMALELGIRPRQLVKPASAVPDLRALRLAAGLDAYEVVRAIHLSLPTYRKWEQGRWRKIPTVATMNALAKTLKSSPAEVERAFQASREQFRERQGTPESSQA